MSVIMMPFKSDVKMLAVVLEITIQRVLGEVEIDCRARMDATMFLVQPAGPGLSR